MNYLQLYTNHNNKFTGLKRVELLKKVEEVANGLFTNDAEFKKHREILGKKRVDEVVKAILESDFKIVDEFSEDFYKLYESAVAKENLTRELILAALENEQHGFTEFECILIDGSIAISNLYDTYYVSWLKEVHTSPAAKEIKKLQKSDPKKLKKIISRDKLNNHYTFIMFNKKEGFYQLPYATYLERDIQMIAETMLMVSTDLHEVATTDEEHLYAYYLKHYAYCLLTEDEDKLEEYWEELDYIWMDVRNKIQVVHDMEYGYGDPLRTKVIPSFSIRFEDTSYKKENTYIEKVKEIMVAYFAKRKTQLTTEGLSALKNSMAAIYYLSTRTGMDYHFRFSGQCIPNRHEVRTNKGVKIFFDPVSTAIRSENVKELTRKAFADESLVNYIDAIDSIVNHVASHEFGHAIYGLDAMKDVILTETKSLLEEPRAELTSLTTMLLLNEEGLLSDKNLESTLFNFAAHDLRRFADFTSNSTRPYIISAINAYKVYEKVGYVKKVNNKLEVDLTKTKDVLKAFKDQFEEILTAEDKKDGKKIETILKDMQKETPLIHWLVKLLS